MRTVRFTVVMAMLVATLSGIAAADPAPISHWRVGATLGLGLDHVATSCPTVTVCTAAAGGELLTTSDGGATWVDSTAALPTGLAEILDVSCPAATVCVLVARRTDGSTAVLTGPGTGPFTAATAPDSGTATAVSCAAASHCVVTDGATAWTTHDRGATWRSALMPRVATFDGRVTCTAGTNRCVVYGNFGTSAAINVSTDDGRTWTEQNDGRFTFTGLYALDCPTVTVCFAGGQGNGGSLLYRTTDGGADWFPISTPAQPYGIRSLSCATTTSCSAFGLTPGDVPFAWSTSDGTTWTAQPVTAVDTTPSPQVDCPAAGRCRAVGGGVAYVTDDGTTWSDRSLPTVPQEPRGISCPRQASCVAVSTDAVQRPVALTTTDAGVTWTSTALPAATGQPTAISCVATTRTCVTVGAYSAPGNGITQLRSAVSKDLGATWTAGRPSNVQGFLWSVSCPTTTTCLAGGYDRHSAGMLWLTTDGARTWTVLTPPTGLSQDNAVSCTGPTTCVVESSPSNARPVAFVTKNLGATWLRHPMPGDAGNRTYYVSVSCGPTTCIATGGNSGSGVLARSTDGGTTWSAVAVPAVAQGSLGNVSCANDLLCAAPGYDYQRGGGAIGLGTRDGGATWTAHPVQGNHVGVRVGCAVDRCYVPATSAFGNPIVVTGVA